MKKSSFGVFEIVVPAVGGQPAIPHGSKVKVRFVSPRSSDLCLSLPALTGTSCDRSQ